MDKKSIDEPARLSERRWKLLMLSTPIPCVDVIVERGSEILLGFRKIAPYRNVWALPGGRILKHEWPEETASRVLEEINISAEIKDLVGVFPIRFPRHPEKRYDITLCLRSSWARGEPKNTTELARFIWVSPRNLPKRTGENYVKMIEAAEVGEKQHTRPWTGRGSDS